MIKLNELYALVEEKMKQEVDFSKEDKKKQEEILKIYRREQDLKLLATEGSEEAREFTRNKIYFILSELKEDITRSEIDTIIKQYHVDYYRNIFTDNDSKFIKKPIDEEIEEYFQKFSLSHYDSFDKKLGKLAQIVYQELYGYSILDELIFESEFNEVAANRYDFIWIQYKGIKRRIPNRKFKFISKEYYNKIVVDRLTSTARDEMNAGVPYINCTLKNGFRVAAARDPLSLYYVVSVRLFVYKNVSEDSRSRFMEAKMLEIIRLLTAKGRRNVAIIGEQGAGKTTAADELIIRNLDDDIAIGLAEYTHELSITAKYPKKNAIEFQYGTRFKPGDITEMFFRFNRDIMIYGEVRSAAEALEIVKAMLRQARGSLFTFHSSSIKRMIHDLRQLLMQTGFYTDYREAQFDVADAVDIAIQIKLERDSGTRYVYRISEIIATDIDKPYITRDLFVYDKEKKKYIVNGKGISAKTIESCLEYEMTADEGEDLQKLFIIGDHEKSVFEYMAEEI